MSALQPLEVSKPALSSRSGGRHQIKRSISELTSPVRLHRHHHNHQRRDRHNDDKEPLSTNPATAARHSLDVSRSEGVTPLITPNQSRRASVMMSQEVDPMAMPREDREEDVRREREKAATRVEGLKQSLVDLNTFSTTTSKRLDDAYFAVLEKMSTLQNTVAALKDLAETSRDIHATFDKGARGLESDIVSQLGAIGRFDNQQRRIESLQGRIHGGRTKIKSLSERIDLVRDRMETWERADKEWQERTRKRLRVIWTVMSVVFLAVVCLFLGIRYSSGPEWNHGLKASDEAGRALPPAELLNASKPGQILEDDDTGSSRTLPWEKRGDDGERLRAFDEL